MSRDILRAAVAQKVADGIIPALINAIGQSHGRGGEWQVCECEWCSLKRRATSHIGDLRCGDRERRADIRAYLRNQYRAELRAIKES
jgi:hypothetical protein